MIITDSQASKKKSEQQSTSSATGAGGGGAGGCGGAGAAGTAAPSTLCVISAHRAPPTSSKMSSSSSLPAHLPAWSWTVSPKSAAAQHQHQQQMAAAAAAGKKANAVGAAHTSALRQLFPIAVCILTFATVLSLCFLYAFDTTEFRHQQFRLNMSRDYELYGVRQDEPTLLTYIREIHLKKYPFPFMKDAPEQHTNFSSREAAAAVQMGQLLAGLVGNKRDGVFVQSLPAGSAPMATAPWLMETLGWGGMIVEPDVRIYFGLRQQNAHRDNVQVVHSCLSQNGYPKEVTLHEHNDVRINSLLDEDTSSFNTRVKCFPLYTLMLAVNHTEVDVLSMGCQGDELQILETVPFKRVLIRVIAIHLQDYYRHDSAVAEAYAQNVTRFLQTKSYRLVRTVDHSYVYQRNFAAKARRV